MTFSRDPAPAVLVHAIRWMHLQQRRMVELRQKPSFVDEAAQPGREGVGIAARAHGHRHVLGAYRQRARHVFLEGGTAIERQVVRQVDDAEAALTDDRQELELVQPRRGGQRVRMLFERRGAGTCDDGALVVVGLSSDGVMEGSPIGSCRRDAWREPAAILS